MHCNNMISEMTFLLLRQQLNMIKTGNKKQMSAQEAVLSVTFESILSVVRFALLSLCQQQWDIMHEWPWANIHKMTPFTSGCLDGQENQTKFGIHHHAMMCTASSILCSADDSIRTIICDFSLLEDELSHTCIEESRQWWAPNGWCLVAGLLSFCFGHASFFNDRTTLKCHSLKCQRTHCNKIMQLLQRFFKDNDFLIWWWLCERTIFFIWSLSW